MTRRVQRLAWRVAKWLTHRKQTDSVMWWTAALMRFALTGEKYTVEKLGVSTEFLAKGCCSHGRETVLQAALQQAHRERLLAVNEQLAERQEGR